MVLISSSPTSSIVLGCSVAVVSSAIQSLGITLQRKSHLLPHIHLPDTITDTLNTTNTSRHTQRKKRNMWMLGFMLFIVANILGSLIQISTLPLIVLSPLQSIGLIFNSILSCLLLPGEKFTSKLAYGTIIISFGAFIIAYNGNIPPVEDLDPLDGRFQLVMEKFLKPSFLSWFVITFVTSAILFCINVFLLRKNPHKKGHFIKGINYGIISGTLTAHTFLFAKSIIDVIIEQILNNGGSLDALKDPAPYILLLTMLAIIGLQLTAFNLGLKQISTSILYPLCFLIYNMMNLINDLIFNSLLSSHRISYLQFTWIVLGLFSVLCGVVIISWDSAFNDEDDALKNTAMSEDEYLMYLDFPYNQQSQEYCKLQDSSNNSVEHTITISSLPMDTDISESNETTLRSPNRTLTFEQTQLLSLLDI